MASGARFLFRCTNPAQPRPSRFWRRYLLGRERDGHHPSVRQRQSCSQEEEDSKHPQSTAVDRGKQDAPHLDSLVGQARREVAYGYQDT